MPRRELYGKLTKYDAADASQATSIIDTIKQVSELMIWGDKREERFFEYFCEKGFLARFDSIMRTCGSTAVQKQVLQTMMILMQNIRDQRSLMYSA